MSDPGSGLGEGERVPGAVRVKRKLKKRPNRRRRNRIALIVALLVVIVAGAEVVRIVPALRDLTDGADGLRDTLNTLGTSPADWTSARIAASSGLLSDATQRIDAGRDRLEHDPLMLALRALPIIGDQVRASFDLADSAQAAAVSLKDEIQVASAYTQPTSPTQQAGTRLLRLIEASSGPLGDAESKLGPPVARLNDDARRPLLPPLRQRVRQALDLLGPRLRDATAGAAAGRYAPAAMGSAGPRTYLILLPNPGELRPSGGFSGAVGTVTFDHGIASGLTVRSQDVYDALLPRKFDIPQPLAAHLKFQRDSLEIGDAGWDPDFPSTARLSEQMFTSATGTKVDGTISIDPYAVEGFLKVTGPVDVPGYGSLDANNFFTRLDEIVNVEHGPGSGKAALGPVSQTVLQRVLTQPVTAFPRFLTVLQEQSKGRHIQLALKDQAVAAAAQAARYDGALQAAPDDYLMIVDANVGATKSDLYLRKAAALRAEVPSSGLSRHEIIVRYELPPPADDIDRALNPGRGEYHDYVRFYLPETAQLAQYRLETDGQDSHGAVSENRIDHHKRVIGAFFALPRGHVAEIRLDYQLALLGGNSYNLLMQKQAGILGMPVRFEISYPGGVATRRDPLQADANVQLFW